MNKKTVLFLFLFSLSFSALTAEDSKKSHTASIIQKVELWYEDNMNYATLTGLMVVESSFIPFPSEVVVPPAAFIACKPESKLNIFLVVLFATIGALLGAYVNYGLAYYLGRPIVYKLADSKLGHLFLLSSAKIEKAEVYFNKRGKVSTFIGRLIPGIRQLISVPAGLAKMNFISFTFYTILGAGIWNSILAFLGYIAHGQIDLIYKYSQLLGLIIVAICSLVLAFFVIRNYRKKKKKRTIKKRDD